MPTRRLLYLTAQRMTAYRWQSSRIDEEATFALDEAGVASFTRYLGDNPRSTFSLLANVAEEAYQSETIPLLGAADRRRVIERKLAQQFLGSKLSTALSLGRQRRQRTEERLLLAALTDSEFFAPWLVALQKTGAALAGVYSQALLGKTLLRRLRIGEERCLLLSVQDQSIRQSYFENGQLRFSRLAQITQLAGGSLAQTLASEAQRLQQYLYSQRLLARNQPIRAYLLVHANLRSEVARDCVDSETLPFELLDIDDAASRCGLRTPPADSHSETLFLHLLAVSPPKEQFADDEQRHAFHLQRIRSLFYGTAAAGLAACLLLATVQLFLGLQLETRRQTLNSEASALRAHYTEITRSFPAIPADNDTLRRIIDRYAEIEAHAGTPQTLYVRISRALDATPQVEVDAIDWSMASAGAPATASGKATPETPATGAIDSARLSGTLRLALRSTPRQVLSVFNGFVAALRADPQLRVAIVQQPFDVGSEKMLSGGETVADGDSAPTARSFVINVTRVREP